MDTQTAATFFIGFTIGAGVMFSVVVIGYLLRKFAASAEADALIYNLTAQLREDVKTEPKIKHARRKPKKS